MANAFHLPYPYKKANQLHSEGEVVLWLPNQELMLLEQTVKETPKGDIVIDTFNYLFYKEKKNAKFNLLTQKAKHFDCHLLQKNHHIVSKLDSTL